MAETKQFKELSKDELSNMTKDDRIKYYQDRDAHYGLKEGLFRVTRMSRHEDKHFENGDAASFGYNVVPAGSSVDTKDFKPKAFVWINQLINKNTGTKVIEAMDKLMSDLEQPTVKSLLVNIKYRIGKNGYINVNSVYRRESKTAQADVTATTSKDEKNQPKVTDTSNNNGNNNGGNNGQVNDRADMPF